MQCFFPFPKDTLKNTITFTPFPPVGGAVLGWTWGTFSSKRNFSRNILPLAKRHVAGMIRPFARGRALGISCNFITTTIAD